MEISKGRARNARGGGSGGRFRGGGSGGDRRGGSGGFQRRGGSFGSNGGGRDFGGRRDSGNLRAFIFYVNVSCKTVINTTFRRSFEIMFKSHIE